jgi:diguanylate cyclase (GGDEF)-like protein
MPIVDPNSGLRRAQIFARSARIALESKLNNFAIRSESNVQFGLLQGQLPVSKSPNLAELQDEILLLRAVIDNYPGGLMLIDKNLKLVFCNEQQKKLLDYPPYLFEHGNPSLEQLFRFNAIRGEYGEGDIEKHVSDRMALVQQRRAHVFERTRPNGTVLEIRGVPLAEGGFMITYLDITGRRSTPKSAVENAEYDKLTGLPKGVLLRARIVQMVANCKAQSVAALHCIDLDDFQRVNDKFGEAIGDAVLRDVSRRLQEVVRGNDTVARIGGDRFVILESDVKRPSDVVRLAGRIIHAMEQPFEIGGQTVSISASAGFALVPRDGTEPESLLAKAEAAVRQSKMTHRGSFEAGTANWN